MFVKVIFLYILLTTLGMANEKSCYTVQLVSATNSYENYDRFSSIEASDSVCKLMEIANKLTVRCGCYVVREEAKEKLLSFQSRYSDAYIRKTYKYRFDNLQQTNVKVKSFQKKTIIKHEKIEVEYQNTNTTDVQYAKAMKYYKKQDFRSSYTLLKSIYLQNLQDIKFNYYLGKSAYETGHYETALAAFERVSMQDAGNIQNKLEMARTYFMLKMYEDAELIYKDVLSNPNIPQNIRRNIEFSLAQVAGVQQKSFTYATVMAGFLYDSNVNYGNVGSFEYSGLTLPGTKKLSDTGLEVFANIVNIYDIGSKNGFAVKNSFSFYSKKYKNNKQYNINYFTYNPSLIYKVTHYTAELVGGIDIMEFGGQKYLTSFSLMPRFELNHSPTLKSITHLKYQRKKFTQTAQHDLDANRYELMYALQDILTPRSYVQANLYGTKEVSLRGTNLYVDYNELKFNLSYANQFSNLFGVDMDAQVSKRKYQKFSTGFNSTRADISKNLALGLTMKVIPQLRVRLSSSYEDVDSNQKIFSYKKQIISANVIKAF